MNLRWTQLLDTESRQPLSHINSGLNSLALYKTSNKSTSKGITSPVSIADLLLFNGVNWELLWSLLSLGSNDSWESALGDNSNALALVVGLWQIGKVLSDLGNISGLQAVGLSVGKSLTLVTDDNIPVWGGLVKWILEELADEWCGEGDNEGLVVLGGLLSNSHDGLWADGEVVATDVDELGLLDQGPDLWLLQVLHLVVVCSSKVGDHGSVVTSDNDTAAAGLLLWIDAVLDTKAGLLVSLLQDAGILVVTDAAKVDDGVVWEDILGTAGGVLGGSASNELGVEFLEIIVESEMLLLSENGIVLLQVVLLEESGIASGLDVCE